MRELLENGDRRARLGRAAGRHVQNEFSLRSVSVRAQDLYDGLRTEAELLPSAIRRD
jgi:hypothetical protein